MGAEDGGGVAGDDADAEIPPLLPRVGAVARLVSLMEIKCHHRDRNAHLSPPSSESLNYQAPIRRKTKQKGQISRIYITLLLERTNLHNIGIKNDTKSQSFSPSLLSNS